MTLRKMMTFRGFRRIRVQRLGVGFRMYGKGLGFRKYVLAPDLKTILLISRFQRTTLLDTHTTPFLDTHISASLDTHISASLGIRAHGWTHA